MRDNEEDAKNSPSAELFFFFFSRRWISTKLSPPSPLVPSYLVKNTICDPRRETIGWVWWGVSYDLASLILSYNYLS